MTYLIIGGSSGIGAALFQLLSSKHEVITMSRENKLQSNSWKFMDVLDVSTFPELANQIDGLIYCPGSILLKPFKHLKIEDFQKDLEINFLGAIKVIQKYLPLLQQSENASIVLFSTIAVKMGMPFHASIASAKGAIEALTRSLAAEFAPRIRVNCIAPSLIETPLSQKFIDSDQKKMGSVERHPLKKIGNANDLATLSAWLLSDASQFMTGQIISIDGGISSVKI